MNETSSLVERDLYEIASLKKNNNALKLQIDKLRHELSASGEINGQLTKQCEGQQQRIGQLNKFNGELRSELSKLSDYYESQVMQLKTMVQQKSREIEDISLKVLPTMDHDLLRIKILNQVELPHRQQIQSKDDHIRRQQQQILQLAKRVEGAEAKYDQMYLLHKEELRRIDNDHRMEMERIFQQVKQGVKQTPSDTVKKLKREVEDLRVKLQLARRQFRYLEQENNPTQITANGMPGHSQNNNKRQLQLRNNELRQAKQVISRLQRDLNKSKEDLRRGQERQQQLNIKVSQLREKVQSLQHIKHDKQNIEMQLNQVQNKLRMLNKQNQSIKQQRMADQSKLTYLQKQLSNALQTIRNSNRPQIREQPPQERQNMRINLDQLNIMSELAKYKRENLNLIERLTEKQKQIQRIQQNNASLTNNKQSNQKIEHLKEKLKQANNKIVTLLNQKIRNNRH